MRDLADFIEGQIDELSNTWSQREGNAGRGFAKGVIRALVSSLRDGPPAASADLGADLQLVIREYSDLRSVIYDSLERANFALSISGARTLSDFFSSAIAAILAGLAVKVAASGTQLRSVSDSLPVLVCLVTRDETYAFANKTHEAWFGIPQAQLLGRKLREVMGEAAFALLVPYARRGLAGESLSFEQHNVPYLHGGTRDVKISLTPYREPSGEPNGYVALLEDISARRQLEADRDRAARQRTEVLESIADPFVALDATFRIVLVNSQYEALTGNEREAIIGHSFWSVPPASLEPNAEQWVAYHRCMETRIGEEFVDFSERLNRWSAVRVFPTGDGGIAVFFRDISIERTAEERLRHQAEFEQQLIGIVSHDLRNPLSAINLGTATLARSDELNERGLKTVLRIQTAAKRAIRMVEDLLDFTQARLSGGIPISLRPSDLHEVARAVVAEVETTHADREVTLTHRGDARGMWDADRLSQVVQNLVTNALTYSPERTPIHVTTSGEGNEVVLTVQNAGAVIGDDKLESLFRPMQRGTSEMSRANRSVGLGLFIVRAILEAHRGRISVTSTPEMGTTFRVSLPRA